MRLPRISALELMTENPRTVRVDDAIEDAAEVLQTMDFRHLPVVDEHGDLVGMLSDRDLRAFTLPRPAGAGELATAPKARAPVATVMSGSVLSVSPDADIAEIMELMLEHKIGALPVVDGEGALIGIVSYVDVLRCLLEEE